MNRRESIGLAAAGLAVSRLGGDFVATAAGSAHNGWIPIFNGHDVADWDFFQEGVGETDRNHAVTVHDGMIHILSPSYSGSETPGFGHLATRSEYSNYHLRADFKWGTRRYAPRELAKRNSGILYHMAADKGVVWPDSIEFQVQETDVADAILVNTRALNGASLARIRSRDTAADDLLAIGRRCAATLKGKPNDHAVLLYDDRGLPK